MTQPFYWMIIMNSKWLNGVLAVLVFTCNAVYADVSQFSDGPLIKGFGKNAPVQQSFTFDKATEFKIAFDVAKQGDTEKVNRKFDSLARFLNMHVANGVNPENIKLALVVHGKAGYDLLSNNAYQAKFDKNNPNNRLLEELLKNNVAIVLCGQSAAYYDIQNKQLHNGVQMALSAMTAHVMLQKQGFTVNPF